MILVYGALAVVGFVLIALADETLSYVLGGALVIIGLLGAVLEGREGGLLKRG